MADLMIASPAPIMTTPTATSTGGGSAGMVVDSSSVTGASSALLSLNLQSSAGGGGVGVTSPSLSNGKTVIPHPQKSNNNGHEMSCTGNDNNSSIYNYKIVQHLHHNHSGDSNHNGTVGSSVTAATSSTSSPTGVGLLQHHRNHSHPLLFSSSANNSSNHVDSSSSPSEMATTNDSSRGAAVVNSSVVTALPSSSSTTATTMDILNLDFVNGNSSYFHNPNSKNERDATCPLSHWSQSGSAGGSHPKIDSPRLNTNNNSCIDYHRDLQSVKFNVNNKGSTVGDSTTPTASAKVPGEIPESVMKYLLTKTDSVDSTKSSHSSSGNTPSSTSHSSTAAAVPISKSAPSSSEHTNNKRLQEFLVDLDTLQSTSEIAKVLENFNAILEKIEQEDDKEALEGLEALTTPLSPSVLQCPTATVSSTSRIKNSVETLAELLLSGCGDEEDEDLLIIIDENDSESLQAGIPVQNSHNGCIGASKGVDVSVFIETDSDNSNNNNNADEEDYYDEDDDVSSLVEIEADLGELEEGYESDRPIVRASMRKLRPVKLLPMPSSSSSSHHHHHHNNTNNVNSTGSSSNCNANPSFSTPPPTPVTPRANSPVDPNVGLATTLNSPLANKIIVTSLMNNLNSPSSSSGPTNISSNIKVDCNESHSQQRTSGENLLAVSNQANLTVAAACSSSVNNNSFVPTLDNVLHVASSSTGSATSSNNNSSGNNSQMRCHSRNQSNTSQIVQLHQNPVTVTTNPAGFEEASSENNGSSGSGSSSNAHTVYGVQQRGSSSNSNGAGPSSSSVDSTTAGTSSGCALPRDSCSGGVPPSNATSSETGNSPGGSNSQARNGTSANNATGSSTNRSTTTASNSNSPDTTTNNNSSGARSRPRAPQAPSQQQRANPAVLRMPAGRWPHRLSSVLAVVGCTLGLNNICRFSLLSVQYGANFILQFIFLSLVFGIPLLTFHMSIGQYLSSGIIDMWKISPIFQGIGVGLVISQAMIGIYTTVGVSWIFIYFRDSFITRQDQYRWGKCVREFGDCDPSNSGYNSTTTTMSMYNETVPDYFNAVVLQRSSSGYPESAYVPSSLKFTVAFNLAVVWMLVFVSLSKGLKSYGKVVHGFVLAPVAALFVLAFKMVNLVQAGGSLFGQTKWSSFFFSSQTWVAAARETFFTWGLLGACVMQITAHNRHSHSLKSDSLIVIMVTMIVLMLSAFIGNACYSILTSHNAIASMEQFSYVPSSFESKASYRFLEVQDPDNPVSDTYDHQHISFLMGVRVIKPGSDYHQRSGYQVLRLATELFPATMAVLSHSGMSSFWTVLFYFAFVLFGIAQQIAIWHCVIKGIIAVKGKVLRSWETTITFFVCGLGFVLGLPLCTETGIFIEYFMDYAIGSGWWIMVLYLLELIAVFIVRGAPYCGENIVTVLITGRNRVAAVLAPLISFIWNVIMPVAILVLSIASFKSGNIRELYDWNPKHGYRFWPSWTREVGSLIQLVPILAVPFVAILQSCRYLSSGPPDLFDRMQQLYRPNSQGVFGNNLSGSFNENGSTDSSSSRNRSSSRGPEDPPPKYTPPPSYSTATGAKIAKFLRNSFRRSIRRLSSPSGGPSTSSASPDNLPPPPNYASVILEINSQRTQQSSSCAQTSSTGTSSILNPIMVPPPAYDESTMAGPTISGDGHGAKNFNKPGEPLQGTKLYQIQLSQTLGRSLAEGSKERASLRRIASDITSRDIARMLRASLRRSNRESPEASTSTAARAQNAAASSSYSVNSSPGQGIIVTIPASSITVEGCNGTPCEYTFGPSSIEKVEYDLEMLNAFSQTENPLPSSATLPSTSAAVGNNYSIPGSSSSAAFGFNFGFNRARNRNSNDSQLALITNGVYEDLSVTSGGLMGALDGEIEIDQFTQLNLPRRDSLSQLNVMDLGQQGSINPTFQIHNAIVTTNAQTAERVESAADSEA